MKSLEKKIKFTVRKPYDKYPMGFFRVQLVEGSKILKSKDGSLSKHSAKDAYSAVTLAANLWSKEHKVDYVKPTLAELTQKYLAACTSMKAGGEDDENLISIFGHAGRFKAAIKHAYKEFGFEQVDSMLDTAKVLVDEIHAPEVAKMKAFADANGTIARELYKIAVRTGVDMADKCPDDNIRRLYKTYFTADGKAKTYYILEGEMWDGIGNPPVAFKQWAEVNKKDSYNELLLLGGA